MVVFADKFWRTGDSLGSNIKVALSCNDFVQFVDKKEQRELKREKKKIREMDDSSSNSE